MEIVLQLILFTIIAIVFSFIYIKIIDILSNKKKNER